MNLSELVIEPVRREEEARFLALMQQHHYLGAPHKIGESAFYAAVCQGEWVALSSFYAAALKSTARDRWLGWHPRDRIPRLHLITSQSRFLILKPHPNLASRTLSLLRRQVAADWPLRFGHPVLLMETFVDLQRFKGSCYLADNWQPIGESAGYRRTQGGYQAGSSKKMMFVHELKADARRLLSGAHLDSYYFPEGVCRKMYTDDDFKTILDCFSQIDDPRGHRGRRYRLETLLAIAAAATVAGAKGYLEIREWVEAQSDQVLRRYFRVGIRRGQVQRPSIYCIRQALISVDPEQFDGALREWQLSVDGFDEAIAIDGKTIRGAIDDNGRQIHVLGACGHETRTHYGKKKMQLDPGMDEEVKYTNEIGACIPLLESIGHLKNRVVTGDAMLTQHEIARCIRRRGAHYMLILKDNQKELAGEVGVYFERLLKFRPDAAPDFCTVTGDETDARKKTPKIQHGRHERRGIWVGDQPEVMEYLNEFSKFEDIAQIFRIHRHVEHYEKGVVTKTTDEVVVGFTSLPADRAGPKRLLELNRKHWTIESNHNILDSLKTWQEDQLRIRKGSGPENLTALRRFAIALIRRHSEKIASTIRRLKCNTRMLLDYLGLTENTRRAANPAAAAC